MFEFLLVAAVLGGRIAAASPAVATAPAPPAPQFSETLVVTTTLKPEEASDSTATVDVVTAGDIAARQAITVADVIATVPGVAVARSGSPGHVTSTFLRGAESNQTLVLWNGIPLNDPILGGFDWALLPTEGVERVEIVRGPYSALYGSSAMGGVVQVLTGGGKPGARLWLEGGSDGYRQGRLAAGYDLGPVRLDLAGHLRRGDGELRNDFFNGSEGIARAQWPLTPGSQLGLLLRGNDSQIGIPLAGSEERLRRRSSWEERQVALPFAAVAGPWQLEALLSAATAALHFRDPDDSFFSRSDSRTQALRGRAVASYAWSAQTWLAAGAEGQREQATSTSNLGPALDHDRLGNAALFGQLHTGWGPARLDAGLRGDQYQRFGRRVSPHLGVAIALGPALRLHAAYGEGFRAPRLGELFFPFSGNPRLKPEVSRAAELGVELSSGPWRAGLIGFDNRLRDLIEYDFVTNQNFNVGRARSRGLEAEAGVRTRSFEARANATWLDAKNLDSGLRLLRRPRQSANLLLTWRPGERWTLNLVERYVGRRLDIDPATFAPAGNPAYARLDLAAQWRLSGTLTPFFRIENAAGRRYSEVLGFPAPRRELAGGVLVRW